jgi:hypothetical protein
MNEDRVGTRIHRSTQTEARAKGKDPGSTVAAHVPYAPLVNANKAKVGMP